MICKFNSFFEFSHMYQRKNNSVPISEVFPVDNATEIIELDPEDIILPVADDPVDFIIELGNECEDLQYTVSTTSSECLN